jgi:hypothetical protein
MEIAEDSFTMYEVCLLLFPPLDVSMQSPSRKNVRPQGWVENIVILIGKTV